ncbi:MAG: hypothetical protein EBX38_06225, partial [Actinobacteria bacterium]|nr:hypothetical protein [Actinomycetota bacterium]
MRLDAGHVQVLGARRLIVLHVLLGCHACHVVRAQAEEPSEFAAPAQCHLAGLLASRWSAVLILRVLAVHDERLAQVHGYAPGDTEYRHVLRPADVADHL